MHFDLETIKILGGSVFSMQNYDDQKFMKSVISLSDFDIIVHPITEANQGIVKVFDKKKPGSGPVYFVLAYERYIASVGDETSSYARLISYEQGIAKIGVYFKLYKGYLYVDQNQQDFNDYLIEKEFDLDLRDLEKLPFSSRIINNRQPLVVDLPHPQRASFPSDLYALPIHDLILAINQKRMTLFKGTQAQSFRHNMTSHMYKYTEYTDDIRTLLEKQSLITIANSKHFKYSFKGIRHDYEGVVIVSNLVDISEVEEYYQEE